jgi:fructose-bisphosphate aldolase class I
VNDLQLQKISTGRGFVAALDQSGGSTPGTLAAYGIPASAYSSDEQMFDLVHQMRSRIIRSPSFDGGRLLAAILFDNTMQRRIDDRRPPITCGR